MGSLTQEKVLGFGAKTSVSLLQVPQSDIYGVLQNDIRFKTHHK